MKIKKFLNVILCCVLIVTSIPFSISAKESQVTEYEPSVSEYVPGEIVITTSNELIDSSSTFVTYSEENEYTLINFEEEKIENAEKLNLSDDTSDEQTYVIEVEGDVLEKCKDLEKLPGVECAEPNLLFQTHGFTMPSEVYRTSGLYVEYQKYYFDLMEIPTAWQTFESTGENVVVAVIDNGYNINSLDFPTNLWTDENGNHGWNTYKNSNDISPIYKSTGESFNNTFHGSNVAGVIGMVPNGSNGVGAAYNSQLMLINAAHYISDTSSPQLSLDDIVEAIDYAIDNGADIINMSIGAYGTASTLESAVDRAYDAGIALIASAGNNAYSTTYAKAIPASYENVIGVMASDKTDTTQLSDFSNYDPSGKYYDIAAPGVAVLGCSSVSTSMSVASGTSQASPLVAACAALYLAEYPDATVDELYNAIRNSPTTFVKSNSSVVTDETYKFKFLNARELLLSGKTKPEIVPNLNTNVTLDNTLNYIYGLTEGYENISEFVTITEGTGTTEFLPAENGNGTGSVFNVYDIYGDLYKSYTIVIFGDTNGDSFSDGQDAVLTSWIIDSPTLFTDAQKFASDVDFDGSVAESDYMIIANAAIDLDFVSQIK